MSVGGYNPLPVVVGGEPSLAEAVYFTWRSALGEISGGVIGPDGGIEDAWRFARAAAIGAIMLGEEAAMAEFFPISASAKLPEWQDLVRLPRAGNDVEARAQVAGLIRAQQFGDLPHLQQRLRNTFNDATITVTSPVRELQVETYFHRGLADRTGDTPYGTGVVAVAPHYSSAHIVTITWPVALTQSQVTDVRRIVRRALPSWGDFQIIKGTGFELGVSILGEDALE